MKILYTLLFALCALLPASGVDYAWSTFAGKAGGPGYVDSVNGGARFSMPYDAAVDGSGNVYVADTGNNLIRKITPGGTVTTLAGSAGQFNSPFGVAVDGSGTVYVADANNHVIRKITPGGTVTTLAGLAGISGNADGTGSAARFGGPWDVAVDGTGNVYVAEPLKNVIRKITPGGTVTTLAGLAGSTGSANGTGSAARFDHPFGVAVDGSGNVYVADSYNKTVRKITPARVVTTLAGLASAPPASIDGTGSAARFWFPMGVTVDGSGNVYVTDDKDSTIRKITSGGVVTTLAGKADVSGSVDGVGAEARFAAPDGIAMDGSGNLYVAEHNNHTIRKIASGGMVTTLAGSAPPQVSVDGTGGEARFSIPFGVAVDGSGNVYVADGGSSNIRKITPAAEVTTLAGPPGQGRMETGSADGTGGAARFNGPYGVAVDGDGNVYATDSLNSTIRKITPGGTVTTLAGLAGSSGNADGTGSAARFGSPQGVAVGRDGNLYVADLHTIRKITPGGTVTTLAGLAGNSGSADGTGPAARFYYPSGVAVDGSGNLYVADSLNHTIRKITPGGTVTTLAGLAGSSGSADGTGSAARFDLLSDAAVDSIGNVYVADTNTIRKITQGGMVSTIGGKSGVIGSLDGTGAAARFGGPVGMAVDAVGNLYVGDSEGAIRKGVPTLSILESWRKTHFGIPDNSGDAADSVDFDGDGLVNLVEFAFGLDPKASASAQLPTWQVSDGKLTVSFPVPAGVSGVTYGAEWNTNLSSGSWTPIADGGMEGAHSFSVPMAGRPSLFVRFTLTAS